MAVVLAADTGGTFTDLAGYDKESGELFFGKTLTRYANLVDGVLDCVKEAGIDFADVEVLKHGTTHIINAFVQRSGAKTALVTTKGFSDILKIGRANRPITFNLEYQKDAPLIPKRYCFGVEGRLDARGNEIQPVNLGEIATLAQTFKVEGIGAIAVSFVNAYANPAHENAVAKAFRDALPHVFVCTGTELTREWYEYERASTATANSYVGPRAKEYLEGFKCDLDKAGFKNTFYMMASNGGVLSAARASVQPVALLESGPVGGCIGAVAYAKQLGIKKLVAFDMGGTTAKCVTVENNRFDIQPVYFVGGYEQGFPIKSPILDIIEVGAGGGSIAVVDAQGRLQVGPKSAGAEPGPVAFGRGGVNVTVTDANLVLGRIGAGTFLGGSLTLDKAASTSAIKKLIATPLGYSGSDAVDRAASGILAIANATMASAIKEITIERGLDVREFDLFVFGGGGPLHGASLARELGVPRVIVPPHPGNFSALGMLLTDARLDEGRTLLAPFNKDSEPRATALFKEMETQIAVSLRADFDAEDMTFERQAEMRYVGQMHTIKVPVNATFDLDAIEREFHALYKKRYGHADKHAAIEFVGLRATGFAHSDVPQLHSLYKKSNDAQTTPHAVREVYFAETGKRHETNIYKREHLPIGASIRGPVVLEDYGSTLVAGPFDTIEIGMLGEVIISCGQGVF